MLVNKFIFCALFVAHTQCISPDFVDTDNSEVDNFKERLGSTKEINGHKLQTRSAFLRFQPIKHVVDHIAQRLGFQRKSPHDRHYNCFHEYMNPPPYNGRPPPYHGHPPPYHGHPPRFPGSEPNFVTHHGPPHLQFPGNEPNYPTKMGHHEYGSKNEENYFGNDKEKHKFPGFSKPPQDELYSTERPKPVYPIEELTPIEEETNKEQLVTDKVMNESDSKQEFTSTTDSSKQPSNKDGEDYPVSDFDKFDKDVVDEEIPQRNIDFNFFNRTTSNISSSNSGENRTDNNGTSTEPSALDESETIGSTSEASTSTDKNSEIHFEETDINGWVTVSDEDSTDTTELGTRRIPSRIDIRFGS